MLHGEAFSNHGADLFLQEPQLRLPFFCLLISFALLLLLFVKIMLRLVGSFLHVRAESWFTLGPFSRRGLKGNMPGPLSREPAEEDAESLSSSRRSRSSASAPYRRREHEEGGGRRRSRSPVSAQHRRRGGGGRRRRSRSAERCGAEGAGGRRRGGSRKGADGRRDVASRGREGGRGGGRRRRGLDGGSGNGDQQRSRKRGCVFEAGAVQCGLCSNWMPTAALFRHIVRVHKTTEQFAAQATTMIMEGCQL